MGQSQKIKEFNVCAREPCFHFIACQWRQWFFFAWVMRLGKVIQGECDILFSFAWPKSWHPACMLILGIFSRTSMYLVGMGAFRTSKYYFLLGKGSTGQNRNLYRKLINMNYYPWHVRCIDLSQCAALSKDLRWWCSFEWLGTF